MSNSLHTLFERHLDSAHTSWSVGCFGAIAEFHREGGEEFARPARLERATARGSVRIDPQAAAEQLAGLAWESPGGHGRSWTQGFVAHLPDEQARMSVRTALTRLDDEAGGALFDIGIGAPNIDACVLVDDAELKRQLDAKLGRSIWEPGNHALEAIKEASPTRSFRSTVAEVRVHQHIGRHRGRPTPTGPHTHVIPGLLQNMRAQDATIPLPPGRSAVLGMYPPHALRDELGRARAFARDEWDDFQVLLEDFGPPEHASRKRELLALALGSESACSASSDELESSRATRQLARIVLPQLPHLGASQARLDELARAWQLEHVLRAMRASPADEALEP